MSDIQPLQRVQTSSFRGDEAGLDLESIRAIQNTLGVLSSASSNLSFSPSNFALVSSNASNQPSKESLSFLRSLLLSTTQSALSNSTSSFLAGPSSESDEYGDIALYLCPTSSHPSLGKGSESEILSLLGLSDLLSNENVEIKSHKPPNINSHEYLSKLKDVYCFRVEGATKDGTVLFILIGQYQSDWLGIIGVGIWS